MHPFKVPCEWSGCCVVVHAVPQREIRISDTEKAFRGTCGLMPLQSVALLFCGSDLHRFHRLAQNSVGLVDYRVPLPFGRATRFVIIRGRQAARLGCPWGGLSLFHQAKHSHRIDRVDAALILHFKGSTRHSQRGVNYHQMLWRHRALML